jgi:membrane peptidoglycan carboxypeptidase
VPRDRTHDAAGSSNGAGNGYSHPGNGYGPAGNYDGPNGPGNSYGRRGRSDRANGAECDRRDGQQYGGGQDDGQAPTGLRDRWNSRGRNPGLGDAAGRMDIKARLGAITGTPPAAGPPIRGRAGLGHGQEYRNVLDAPPADDSFDDIAGYRTTGTRSRSTALRDRVDAAGPAGPSRLPGGGEPGGYPRRGGGSGGGRDAGPPARRKGSWWRHWTWKKALAVAGGLCATMLLLVIVAAMYAYGQTQIPTDVSEAALAQSSTVYFGNGKAVVGSFSTGTNRELLTSQQIPAVLKNAVVAAEDRSFYTEGGVSPTGILRAAYEDLSGGTFQGGSTITQQFVRQYYATIGTQQTVSRKMKEIFVAIKLSHEKSKDWILTNYLNTVFLGDDAYGVGAAAETYFNEPALKLNIAQSAMLAAMINQPGFFSPDPHAGPAYTQLVARWHYVLGNMVRDGVITQQQADAEKFPKIIPGQINNGWTGYRGYIMQAVQNELENTYGYTQQEIDTRGLRVVTTFSESMMNALYKAVNENRQQMKADGTPLPSYAHVGAVLEQPGTGAILAMYGGPSFDAKHCTEVKCQYNMAMQSRNQVGSSFKPYVLATAVHQGMNVQNSVLDGQEPICVPPDTMSATLSTLSTSCPPDWFGVNIPGENMGPVDVAQAAAQSSDPAFEDLIHRTGTQNTINMAKAFGVDTIQSGLQAKTGEVGIALGTASLTVEEQATTFATLAADGMYATPHVIAQLTAAGGAPVALRVVHHEVLTPAQAADVDYALSFDTINGTAYPNGVLSPQRPTIGKTGTTDQAQSAFFIGAVPQYSLAVGMFTNSQNELPGGQTLNILASVNGQAGGYGGAWPTNMWRTFMQSQFSSLPIAQLPLPDYTGFTRWVQVIPQPKPVKQHPNPGPSCGLRHRFGGPCPSPGQGGQPSPNPIPTPTSSCVPGPGHPCSSPGPPGLPLPGRTAAAMQLAQAAEEPAVTSLGGG